MTLDTEVTEGVLRIGNPYRLDMLPWGTAQAIWEGWAEFDRLPNEEKDWWLGRHCVIDGITWLDEDQNRYRATPVWMEKRERA